MTGQNGDDAAREQGQMNDQEAFREDPRGKQEVAEQQPETQPGSGDERRPPSDDQDERRGESGRDDAGEATGNPPNAG